MFPHLVFSGSNCSKRRLRDVLDTKNLSYTTNKLIIGSWKFCIFCKGVSSYIWSKIWSFLTLFFLVQIVKKEWLATFFLLKTCFYPTNKLIVRSLKLAFFEKGLVLNFGLKFEVYLPSLFSVKLIKKNVRQCSS